MLWTLCGVGTSYNVAANAEFVKAVPNERRGQAIALATTGIVAGEGLAILVAGFVADAVSVSIVVGGAGLIALAAVTTLALSQRRGPRVVTLPDATGIALSETAVATSASAG
jgi:sugar phosphate permease